MLRFCALMKPQTSYTLRTLEVTFGDCFVKILCSIKMEFCQILIQVCFYLCCEDRKLVSGPFTILIK